MISLLSGRRNFFIEVHPRFYQGQHFYGCHEGAGIQFFLSAWLIQTLFQDALINRYKSTFSWKDQYREEKRHQCEFSADDGEGTLLTFTCIETLKLQWSPFVPVIYKLTIFQVLTMFHTLLRGLIKQRAIKSGLIKKKVKPAISLCIFFPWKFPQLSSFVHLPIFIQVWWHWFYFLKNK